MGSNTGPAGGARAHRRVLPTVAVVALVALSLGSCAPTPGHPGRATLHAATVGAAVPATTTSTTTPPTTAVPTTTAAPTTSSTTTTSARPTATATTTPVNRSPFVRAAGTSLVLDGAPWHPVGINAYELATEWGTNLGCGGMFPDDRLAALLSSLPRHALVRVWAWQGSMATDVRTHRRDWLPLDRLVSAATAAGVELVMSLGSQHGSCDDGVWKDAAWYLGGYRDLAPGDGYTVATVSYWDWVHEVVGRYSASPTVAMWEPINEAEGSSCRPGFSASHCYGHLTCPDEHAAAVALRSFYDAVGGAIHALDANHLVESGSLGGPQCGWVGPDTAAVDASAGIDVTSFHDYSGSAAVTSDLTGRLTESRIVGKPLLVGELGIGAGTGPSCPSTGQRAVTIRAATTAMVAAGVAGVALWNVEPTPIDGCTYALLPGDPAFGALTGSGP